MEKKRLATKLKHRRHRANLTKRGAMKEVPPQKRLRGKTAPVLIPWKAFESQRRAENRRQNKRREREGLEAAGFTARAPGQRGHPEVVNWAAARRQRALEAAGLK